MDKNKKTNLTMLKCSNCGSSVFEQTSDDTYKCGYCGSVAKDDNAEKQSFIKFLSSKSANESKIRIVKSMMGEQDFFKYAIEHISNEKNSPIDILESKFENVEIRYSYYLLVKAQFKLATLSNQYFEDISYSQTKNKKLSINSQKQVEEDVVNESIAICSPLQENAFEGQSEKVYKDLYSEFSNVNSAILSAEEIKKRNIKLPSKTKISEAIDRVINETKTELLENSVEKNVRVMHKIDDIELCIVPEYVLKFEYKNEKFEVSSFAYDLNIVGSIPNDSENLYKQVMQKTAKYPIVSISISAVFALLGFITFTIARYIALAWVCIFAIPVMLVVFASTFFIDKIVTKNILTKRYNLKRTKLQEFFKSRNIDPTLTSEFLNSFEGGE